MRTTLASFLACAGGGLRHSDATTAPRSSIRVRPGRTRRGARVGDRVPGVHVVGPDARGARGHGQSGLVVGGRGPRGSLPPRLVALARHLPGLAGPAPVVPPPPASRSPAAALAIAVGNTLEAVLGVWLLRRLGFSPELARIQDVLVLTFTAATGALASVLAGVLGLMLSGGVSWDSVALTAWGWWLGNALGMLVVGSALMWCSQHRPEPRGREALVLTLLTLGIFLGPLFSGRWTPVRVSAQVLLLLPMGAWAVWRFGSRTAAYCFLLLVGVFLWSGISGPASVLASAMAAGGVLKPRLFLVIVAFTGLLLMAARAERGMSSTHLEVLTTALRGVQEGVLVCEQFPNEAPRLVYGNASFLEMGGWRREDLLGRSPLSLWGDALEPDVHQRLEDAVRSRRPFQGEVAMAHQDGSRVYNEMHLSFVRAAGSRGTFLVPTHRAITIQNRLHAQLASAERIAAVGPLPARPGP